jgi:hypothetical protein
MAKKNNAKTAEAAVLAKQKYDAALEAFKALPTDATEEAKAEAQKAVDEALAEFEKVNTGLLIRFTQSPSGKPFNLAYFPGDEVELPMALAAELIELGFAEAVGS